MSTQQYQEMQDVVIAGAGIAGLATALGLHRKGVRSLVLESSDSLRAAGFAFTTWTNAWRALDSLGVGDYLRQRHLLIEGIVGSFQGNTNLSVSFKGQQGKCTGEHEVRCVRRTLLLETLEKELPHGTIRYSSKVVSIEEEGKLKLLHLADGSTLKTKVLIGCDGVNSVVAKWLGLKKPSFSGRSASRGFAEFPGGHGLEAVLTIYVGGGFRYGILPVDETGVYWFFTWTPSAQDKEVEESATKMKEFMLSKLNLAKVPEVAAQAIEQSDMGRVVSSPLRYRWPFDLLWGNISKGNVCVAGDALHPMTPDLGQGGCLALEDGVVLARCLGDALLKGDNVGAEEKHQRIGKALEKYSKERRWRSFEIISTAYLFGYLQQTDGVITSFLRDKLLSGIIFTTYLKKADFDCGKL